MPLIIWMLREGGAFEAVGVPADPAATAPAPVLLLLLLLPTVGGGAAEVRLTLAATAFHSPFFSVSSPPLTA